MDGVAFVYIFQEIVALVLVMPEKDVWTQMVNWITYQPAGLLPLLVSAHLKEQGLNETIPADRSPEPPLKLYSESCGETTAHSRLQNKSR